jgi:hypothetical protein
MYLCVCVCVCVCVCDSVCVHDTWANRGTDARAEPHIGTTESNTVRVRVAAQVMTTTHVSSSALINHSALSR